MTMESVIEAWRRGALVQYLVLGSHDSEWTNYLSSDCPPDEQEGRLVWRVASLGAQLRVRAENAARLGRGRYPQRRVVCSAIRADDGSVLLGLRHYSQDMHDQLQVRNDRSKFLHRSGDDQGFVDQSGVYMTRQEAYAVALAAGQILWPDECRDGRLYSEALY